MEVGTLFEGDGTCAGDLAANLAVDVSGGGLDGIEKLDPCAFFNPQAAAEDGTADFAVAADDEISGAFDRTGELSDDSEMMATQRGNRDGSGFLDDHIATCLDASVPVGGDFVIRETDVATALRALAGLGLGDGGERVSAIETTHIARRLCGVEQAHQKRAGWRNCRSRTKQGLRFCRFLNRVGIGVLAGFRQAGHGTRSHNALTVPDLEVRPACTALGRDH